ncbi:hypothetical protein IMSAG025_01527 [Muribaculaceae bacterium]|nr:hypothetical protein IMSAG025_01527 [Muribaculaceae bacterium]
MPASMPTQRGTLYSLTLVTPYPAKSMQHKPPDKLITDPTEISVPADADTTNVMPIARIATSLPLFNTSMRRPYKIPLLILIEKKLKGAFPLAIS